MEDTLWGIRKSADSKWVDVLILILMEDTLWACMREILIQQELSLNPYSNGRYSMS